MKILDLLSLVFQNLKARISRIIFTILGIAVGIGTVLFLVSLGYGLQRMVLERITTQEALLTLDVTSPDPTTLRITNETLNEIKSFSQVEEISRHLLFSAYVRIGDLYSQAIANLVDPNYLQLSASEAKIGENIVLPGKAIVNTTFLSLFNLKTEESLEKKISLLLFDEYGMQVLEKELTYQIAGVIEGGEAQPNIFINLKELEKDLQPSTYHFLKVKVKSTKDLEKVRNQIISLGFQVSALSDIVEQANKFFKGVQIVLGIFGTIALIVAGIGLVNTMTISLLQRTNEIGILRAIGASKLDVLLLFLFESLSIALWGGAVGILLGIVSAEIVNYGINLLALRFGGEPLRLFFYPKWFIAFTFFLSVLVGLIGGIFPARKAAKMDPLEALRYK